VTISPEKLFQILQREKEHRDYIHPRTLYAEFTVRVGAKPRC